MKASIFVEIPYNHFIKMPLALAEQLGECTLFKQEYNGNRYVYKESIQDIGYLMVQQKDIILLHDEETIEIEAILEENNRLSRENERLLEKLKKLSESSSTQLEVI
jgi:hypothetical protein